MLNLQFWFFAYILRSNVQQTRLSVIILEITFYEKKKEKSTFVVVIFAGTNFRVFRGFSTKTRKSLPRNIFQKV